MFSSGWDAGGTDDKAGLLSPNFTVLEPSTLSVWYQMNGNGVGSLSLLLYQLGRVRSRPSKLWSISGRQGLDWHLKQAHLSPGHWQVNTNTHARINTHIHKHIYANKQTYTRIHTYIHIRTHIYTHKHAYTHT